MKVNEWIQFDYTIFGAEPYAFFVTFPGENVTIYDLCLSVSFH